MSFNLKNIEDIFSKIENSNKKIKNIEENIDNTLKKYKDKYIENNNNQQIQDIQKLICFFCMIFSEFNYLKNYEEQNLEYKRLCSGYSKAYLMGSDWYKGDNLPKNTYISDNMEILKLYAIFILVNIWNIKNNNNLVKGDHYGAEIISTSS